MNIWSLDKDRKIKFLLFKAQKQLGKESFHIESEDNNDKDLYSIRLIKADQNDVRAFIYTYGQLNDLYGIHLEYPRFHENEFSEPGQLYEDLTLQQIINTLATHFEVTKLDIAM